MSKEKEFKVKVNLSTIVGVVSESKKNIREMTKEELVELVKSQIEEEGRLDNWLYHAIGEIEFAE